MGSQDPQHLQTKGKGIRQIQFIGIMMGGESEED
jgi:hypothetical protein